MRCTSPSSVPTYSVFASCGDSSITTIVPYTSPPAPSLVMGAPPHPCRALSFRVRSPEIGVHRAPRSVVRNSTLPPWYTTRSSCRDTSMGAVQLKRYFVLSVGSVRFISGHGMIVRDSPVPWSSSSMSPW